jgi:hypothetical protein
MRDGFRAACRQFLPLSVRRARRIIVTLPHVLRRLAERLRKQAIRRRAGIPHSLLMHPFRPRVEDEYTVTLIACRLGLEFTTAPRKKLAAAMHCVLPASLHGTAGRTC